MKLTKQTAFSLIEMMLVIVILGIIAVAGVSTMKGKSDSLNVRKAAVQMQQWAEAANNYYNQYGYWPGPSSSTATSAQLNTLIQKHFMSNSGLTTVPANGYPVEINPWGQRYRSKAINNDNEFTLYGYFPSATVAQQVQGILPNASIASNNNKQVVMQIPAPQTQFKQPPTEVSMITLLSGQGSAGDAKNVDHASWKRASIKAPDCKAYNRPKQNLYYYPNITYSLSTAETPRQSGGHYMVEGIYLHVVPYNWNHRLSDPGGTNAVSSTLTAQNQYALIYQGIDPSKMTYQQLEDANLIPDHWDIYGFVNAANNKSGQGYDYSPTIDVSITTSCVTFKPFYMNPNYFTESPYFKSVSSGGTSGLKIGYFPPGISRNVQNLFQNYHSTVFTGGNANNAGAERTYGAPSLPSNPANNPMD